MYIVDCRYNQIRLRKRKLPAISLIDYDRARKRSASSTTTTDSDSYMSGGPSGVFDPYDWIRLVSEISLLF
jgi:hypothetical protein